jgi:predicted component of type VI protein secretion system
MKTKVLLGASIIALLVSASCKKSEDAKPNQETTSINPVTGKKKVTLKIVSSDQTNVGATMRINVSSDAEANKGGCI